MNSLHEEDCGADGLQQGRHDRFAELDEDIRAHISCCHDEVLLETVLCPDSLQLYLAPTLSDLQLQGSTLEVGLGIREDPLDGAFVSHEKADTVDDRLYAVVLQELKVHGLSCKASR